MITSTLDLQREGDLDIQMHRALDLLRRVSQLTTDASA